MTIWRILVSSVAALFTPVLASSAPVQAWWVNCDKLSVDVLTVRSFQGIVNRDAPRLFVVQWKEDLRWVEILNEKYGDRIQLTEIKSEEELFTHPEFQPFCKQVIAYDRSDSDLAMNGALTLAGIYGACVADTQDLDRMLEYGFTVADDRRGYAGWQTNEGVNAWALKLQGATNQQFYCVSEGHIRGTPKSVDTAVSMGMLWFLLDSTGEHIEDQEIQDQILAKYPPHTIATGWWSKEVHDVRKISSYGHTFATNSVNCSFFRHGESLFDIGKQQRSLEPLPEIQPGKSYAFISYTQGDALYFCSNRNMNQWTGKSDEGSGKLVREKYPFGLMHNSIQTIMQPLVPAYLYDSMDPPMQWFSGKAYGYAYPSTLLENGYLAEHLDKGGEAMRMMDLHDLMLNDRAAFLGNTDTSLIEHIVHIMDPKPRSLIIKHPFSENADEKDSPMVFNGIPAFGDPVMERTYADKSMDISATADAIHASMQQRQFFWIFLKNQAKAWEVEDLFQYLEADPRFEDLVLMHPDSFIRLYQSQVPQTFSWRITDDSWVGDEKPYASHGDDSELKLSEGNVVYFKFVVESSTGAESSVKLRLKVRGASGMNLVLGQMESFDWQEETITFMNQGMPGGYVDSYTMRESVEEVLFDLGSSVIEPGEYTFAVICSNAVPGAAIMSRESRDPPWLIAQGK